MGRLATDALTLTLSQSEREFSQVLRSYDEAMKLLWNRTNIASCRL